MLLQAGEADQLLKVPVSLGSDFPWISGMDPRQDETHSIFHQKSSFSHPFWQDLASLKSLRPQDKRFHGKIESRHGCPDDFAPSCSKRFSRVPKEWQTGYLIAWLLWRQLLNDITIPHPKRNHLLSPRRKKWEYFCLFRTDQQKNCGIERRPLPHPKNSPLFLCLWWEWIWWEAKEQKAFFLSSSHFRGKAGKGKMGFFGIFEQKIPTWKVFHWREVDGRTQPKYFIP